MGKKVPNITRICFNK